MTVRTRLAVCITIAAAASGALARAAAGVAAPRSGQTREASEEEIKAAFLFNFAKYVTWPPKALADGTFRICVVADAAFARKIDAVIAGEVLDGRPVVHPPTPPAAAMSKVCDMIFVGAGESGRSAEVLSAVRGAEVLTVGDTSAFAARGGMITFIKHDDRVRFDINESAASRVGLRISSRLLRLARRVTQPRELGN